MTGPSSDRQQTNGIRGARRGEVTSVPKGETYQGAWPRALFRATPRDYSLDVLLHYKKKREEEGVTGLLMGYAIPPFQRPVVWDDRKMIRFVESAVLGLHLGTWLYNKADGHDGDGVDGFHRTHLWLLDGQQRLTALERFFNDAFPVFGLRWSEVPVVEQRRFVMTPFAAQETSETNELVLREIYDRLNFGGVAHTVDQRALPETETPEAAYARIEWTRDASDGVRYLSIPHSRLEAEGWDFETVFAEMTGHPATSILSADVDTAYDVHGNRLEDEPRPTPATAPRPF